ncbi:MAG: M67 family metallopeptidase [Acidobacteriota bacterium]|nr:M67 family metallopeptidase [Acidobacteriota bacterium]
MMSLQLTDDDIERIYADGRATYPEECCGVMIGTLRNGDQAEVVEIVSARNEREDENRHNRFLISPQALMEAQRSARARQFEVVGYYHSHPDHPARPSDFDRDHAWPGQSYLIISVQSGEVADCRSWRLKDDRTAFDEETVLDAAGRRVGVSTAASE